MIHEVPYIEGKSRFYSDSGVKIRNIETGETSNELVTDEKYEPENFEETDIPVDLDTAIE